MAYMATGIGYGIGRAVFPYIMTTIFEATNYRDTILYTVIFFAFSLTAPLTYKEQLPKQRPETIRHLVKEYTHPLKRYVAPWHLANGYLWNAELTGVAVLLFTYVERTTKETMSEHEALSAAANVQTINGAAQMVGAIGLTLLLMKVKLNHYILQIVFNVLIGIACFVLGAYKNVYSFYVTAGILGFMEAIMVGNITCVCHHLYPDKDVVYAFGFHETLGGLAGFIAPYTAGLIQERWGTEMGFYYLGCNSIVGGLVYILAGLIRRSTFFHRPVEDDNETPSDTEASQSKDKTSISSVGETEASSASVEKMGISTEAINYTEAATPAVDDSTKL